MCACVRERVTLLTIASSVASIALRNFYPTYSKKIKTWTVGELLSNVAGSSVVIVYMCVIVGEKRHVTGFVAALK